MSVPPAAEGAPALTGRNGYVVAVGVDVAELDGEVVALLVVVAEVGEEVGEEVDGVGDGLGEGDGLGAGVADGGASAANAAPPAMPTKVSATPRASTPRRIRDLAAVREPPGFAPRSSVIRLPPPRVEQDTVGHPPVPPSGSSSPPALRRRLSEADVRTVGSGAGASPWARRVPPPIGQPVAAGSLVWVRQGDRRG